MMIYTQKVYSKRAKHYVGFVFVLSPKDGFKPCQLPVSNRDNFIKTFSIIKISEDEYFIDNRTIKDFKSFLKLREKWLTTNN